MLNFFKFLNVFKTEDLLSTPPSNPLFSKIIDTMSEDRWKRKSINSNFGFGGPNTKTIFTDEETGFTISCSHDHAHHDGEFTYASSYSYSSSEKCFKEKELKELFSRIEKKWQQEIMPKINDKERSQLFKKYC